MTRFQERSIPYQVRPLGTDTLETLFLMQHFGVPTRLLDWTENPLAGLFFSVRNAPHRTGKKGSILFRRNAIVWVLDPVRWNRGSLAHLSYEGGVLNSTHEILGAYRGIGRIHELAPRPIAMYGAHNSPRIVAQQGAFVLFGKDSRPMEVVATDADFEISCLSRIVITRGVLGSIRDSLSSHGLTDAAMFPDLEGLAKNLRRMHGFEV